jgi:hypothetical protein
VGGEQLLDDGLQVYALERGLVPLRLWGRAGKRQSQALYGQLLMVSRYLKTET